MQLVVVERVLQLLDYLQVLPDHIVQVCLPLAVLQLHQELLTIQFLQQAHVSSQLQQEQLLSRLILQLQEHLQLEQTTKQNVSTTLSRILLIQLVAEELLFHLLQVHCLQALQVHSV